MSCDKTLKRKRVVLSLDDKCNILTRMRNGESGSALAKEYNIGKSTIFGLKSNEDKILRYRENILINNRNATKKKVMSAAENRNLDSAIFRWFSQQRVIGTPISGPILCEKALQLNSKMGGNDNFRASNGWLENFKKRHGIRLLNIQGGKLSADMEAAEIFKKFLSDFIGEHKYSEDCLYNADETGLYWRSLPRKSLASSAETTAPGHKISKDRVTIMFHGNT
ncbi:jerky protein homolog-like [Colletes gigas]|uniref:jerky protein homolog-like n=1 Tax=Colletes gigas TaxID=935657 RepID=UPI001C9B222E|nr:jerky protein homolog-like [Colletes gigas]